MREELEEKIDEQVHRMSSGLLPPHPRQLPQEVNLRENVDGDEEKREKQAWGRRMLKCTAKAQHEVYRKLIATGSQL